jgi:hypothetical protein
MASLGSIVVIAVALLGAPVDESVSDVSLGVGWTVAQVRASLDAPPGPAPAPPPNHDRDREATASPAEVAEAAPATAEPSTSVAPPVPRIEMRPYAHHSDVDARIKEARRARALRIGGAMAVQGAMIIYGITRAIDNAKEAEMFRDERPASQFKPMHPR